MIETLRAEFHKLLTVRSTYIVSILSLLLISFISFWGVGFKGGPNYSPTTLQEIILYSIMITGTFMGILAILHICHEYRYNTIAYSLTISNNRLKVLAAKLVTVAALAVVMTFLTILVAISLPGLGAMLAGHDLGSQTVVMFDVFWRALAFMLGGVWLGLIIGFLVRSVVAAVAIYFVIPTIEPLIQGLLRISNNYLPSSAHAQIVQVAPAEDIFSPLASLGVFSLYLVAGLLVAAVLFMRRDALS